MAKTPVVHHTIREQIAAHIRRAVFSGNLKQGESLREQPLAERFGVSRGPIRDALLELTKEGLLLARQNRGVTVRKRPAPGIRPLLVTLRRQLEVFALAEIFDSIGPVDLQYWEENLQQFRTACRLADMADIVEYDMAFHRSIVARVGDDALTAIWLPMATNMMLPDSRTIDPIGSYTEHRSVYEAMRIGDKDAAIKKLQENIR
jgi:GntR family transcriptional regulator, rspAB operon transcriptional repressor